MIHKTMSYISVALTAALFSCAVFLLQFNASADTVDDVIVDVPVACTMSDHLDTAHATTINPGQSAEGIGTTTFTVFCNDSSGYSIYAVGYSNTEHGNTDLLATNAANPNIATGLATSGNTSAWAMKLIPVTTASSGTSQPYAPTIENNYDDYNIIPSSYVKVATFPSNTDFTIGSSLQSTYRAHISGLQPADTYNGKVKYTLVHPASEEPLQPQPSTAGCINYHANASNALGTMGCQSATDGNSIDLLASNFSRAGYGFAGWSDSFDYATNPNAKFYGPQETITAPVGTTANGLSLYAVWVKSAGNLQDTNKVAELCGTGTNALTTAPTNGAANLSSVSALTDQRDNQTYAIAKLADDKCWMIENLRLENTGTDNTNGSLSQGYGGQFAGLAAPETADKFSITYSANSLYSNDGTDNATNIGTSNIAYRMPRYNDINTPASTADRPQNPTTNSATNSTSNASMYSYGNYYTWHAAIADTTAYSSGDHDTTSICPTGWKIPLGNTSTGDIEQGASDAANKVPGFSYLDRKMGGTGQSHSAAADSLRWRKFPANFVYSSYVLSGSVDNRGSDGYYWSSTAATSYNSYSLSLNSSIVYPGTGRYSKYLGSTVRCVVSGV